MAAIVDIASSHGLSIDASCTNQLNKGKIALHKLLIHIYSHLKQSYIHNKMIHLRVGVVCMGVVHISMCLKEELAWATDKQPRVISNIALFKKQLKHKAVLNLNQYCMHCYVVLSN